MTSPATRRELTGTRDPHLGERVQREPAVGVTLAIHDNVGTVGEPRWNFASPSYVQVVSSALGVDRNEFEVNDLEQTNEQHRRSRAARNDGQQLWGSSGRRTSRAFRRTSRSRSSSRTWRTTPARCRSVALPILRATSSSLPERLETWRSELSPRALPARSAGRARVRAEHEGRSSSASRRTQNFLWAVRRAASLWVHDGAGSFRKSLATAGAGSVVPGWADALIADMPGGTYKGICVATFAIPAPQIGNTKIRAQGRANFQAQHRDRGDPRHASRGRRRRDLHRRLPDRDPLLDELDVGTGRSISSARTTGRWSGRSGSAGCSARARREPEAPRHADDLQRERSLVASRRARSADRNLRLRAGRSDRLHGRRLSPTSRVARSGSAAVSSRSESARSNGDPAVMVRRDRGTTTSFLEVGRYKGHTPRSRSGRSAIACSSSKATRTAGSREVERDHEGDDRREGAAGRIRSRSTRGPSRSRPATWTQRAFSRSR